MRKVHEFSNKQVTLSFTYVFKFKLKNRSISQALTMAQSVDIKRAEPKKTGGDNSFSSYGASGKYDQEDCYGGKENGDNIMYSGNGDYIGLELMTSTLVLTLNVAYTFIPSNLMVHP